MDLFIARQPVFTPKHAVFGYDLLFRSGPENVFPDVDPTQASARVLTDSLMQLALGDLTGDTQAFIHFTRALLLGPYVTMLPPAAVIIEVPETVVADPPVLRACGNICAAGYRLALDNYRIGGSHAALLPLADLLKVDCRAVSRAEQQEILRQARRRPGRPPKLIGTKLETYAAQREAVTLGYDLFQGYYFAAPAVLHTTGLPESRVSYLTLLKEVTAEDLNSRRVADLIAKDVTLTYKLLRYANSPFFGFRRTITSIPQCLQLLGDQEIRRWASLLNLAALGTDKPVELVVESAVRAKFCAHLAREAGLGAAADHCFFIGLFSLLDALLDRPFERIFAVLRVAPEVADTLQGAPGPLRTLYLAAVAYLTGDWPRVTEWLAGGHIPEAALPQHHRMAALWARETLAPVSHTPASGRP